MDDDPDDIVQKMLRPRSFISGSSIRPDAQSGLENNGAKPLEHEMTKSFDLKGLEAFERGTCLPQRLDTHELIISQTYGLAESTSNAANLEYQINALQGVLLALYNEIVAERRENSYQKAKLADFEHYQRYMQEDNSKLAAEVVRARSERDEAIKRAQATQNCYPLVRESSPSIRSLADRLQTYTERFAARISLLVSFVGKCADRLANLEKTVNKATSITSAQHRAWYSMIAEYERYIAELEGRIRGKATLSRDS